MLKNFLKLFLSVVAALNLYVLIGDIFGGSEFNIFDVGSTIWLTVVLYLLFVPGALLYLMGLRLIGTSHSPKARRICALIASPLVATVFFVLAAISADPENDLTSTWIAVLGAAIIFGSLVTLPLAERGEESAQRP